jgi:peroxiredoxin
VSIALLATVLAAIVRASAPTPAAASTLVGHALPVVSLSAERAGRVEGTRMLLPHTGRPTLVMFLFSLCPRCSAEAAAVSALARQRYLDLVVVDSPAETPAITDAYATRLGLSGPVLLDHSGALAARLGLDEYPALLLVDGRDIVRGVWLGETPSQRVSAAVDALSTPSAVEARALD